MTSAGQRKSSIPISGDRDKPTKATGTINPPTTSLKGKSLTKNRPELTVQNDNTWKDMIRHEKLVIKLWNWKWDFLLLPENKPKFRSKKNINWACMQESIDKKLAEEGRRLGLISYQELEKRDYKIKPSNYIPKKSSEWIGWRSKDRENSFDFYRTPNTTYPGPIVPKISFVKEQYGFYRQLKYLKEDKDKKTKTSARQEEENEETNKLKNVVVLPTKNIVHKVKPLLC